MHSFTAALVLYETKIYLARKINDDLLSLALREVQLPSLSRCSWTYSPCPSSASSAVPKGRQQQQQHHHRSSSCLLLFLVLYVITFVLISWMPPPVSIHNAAFDAAHTFLDEDLVMKVAELAVVMRESNAYLSAALATTSRNQSLEPISPESEFFLPFLGWQPRCQMLPNCGSTCNHPP